MKRIIQNKAKQIICKICNKECSAYSITSHIKHIHKDISISEYVAKYGEFRKQKNPNPKRTIPKVKCEICDKEYATTGMFVHLRDTHQMSPDEYVEKYSEYRPNKIRTLNNLNDEHQCLTCGENKFTSHQHLTHHIRNKHSLNMNEYVLQYIFHNEHPLCQCGCDQKCKIIPRAPYKTSFISGHNPNGMTGKRHKPSSINAMSKKAVIRLSRTKGKYTRPEMQFIQLLNDAEIPYITQYKTKYGIVDFYVDGQYMIEIDGVYWHPLQLTNLNIQLLQSAINDKKKTDNIPNLIRIRTDNIPEKFDISAIIAENVIGMYPTELPQYKEVIIQKDYLIHLRETHPKQFKKLSYLILRLLRIFNTSLPKIITKETLSSIMENIPGKICKIYSDNTFNNNCSNVGTEFIKSKSESFWKSSYKGSLSPLEVWDNDDKMYEIIKYRIGDNKLNETFHISQHQLLRGISAKRYTISFFKPVLAAAIYNYFLGNLHNPIVFDPCAGFGGRMIGFKSMYPRGTYIGIEPNSETFNELKNLSKDLSNVFLFNCTLEEFNIEGINYDLAFTSIPYYDLEIYSNPIQYKSYEHWVDTFCSKIKSLPNLVLNVPENLKSEFAEFNDTYKIKSNSSHFSKSKEPKFEWLLDNLKR